MNEFEKYIDKDKRQSRSLVKTIINQITELYEVDTSYSPLTGGYTVFRIGANPNFNHFELTPGDNGCIEVHCNRFLVYSAYKMGKKKTQRQVKAELKKIKDFFEIDGVFVGINKNSACGDAVSVHIKFNELSDGVVSALSKLLKKLHFAPKARILDINIVL